MKKQILSEEFQRMQKLAGIITEGQKDLFEDINAAFEQKFREKYPTQKDFDIAFNEFRKSAEYGKNFSYYPSGNAIDPDYDYEEEDKIRMMIKLEWEKIDPQNESKWKEAIEQKPFPNARYLINLRDKLPR